MVSVLIVEDDARIGEGLSEALADRGHEVRWESSGATALARVTSSPPDLMLLDLGLPDVDGSTLLVMLRSFSGMPIIVVTARVEPEESVRLLDLGADDYITKPFDVGQLEARMRAVLRRVSTFDSNEEKTSRVLSDEPVAVGQLVIDRRAHNATLAGRPLDLRQLDFQLLSTLAAAAGNPLSSASLCTALWGAHDRDLAARLDVHLSTLRVKLGETAREPRYLHRVRGVGIRLVAPTVDGG